MKKHEKAEISPQVCVFEASIILKKNQKILRNATLGI